MSRPLALFFLSLSRVPNLTLAARTLFPGRKPTELPDLGTGLGSDQGVCRVRVAQSPRYVSLSAPDCYPSVDVGNTLYLSRASQAQCNTGL